MSEDTEDRKPPHNAGMAVIVPNEIHGPVTTVSLGKITVRENWGRLFITQEGHQGDPIVIVRGYYPNLIEAIRFFVDRPVSEFQLGKKAGFEIALAAVKDCACRTYEGDTAAHTVLRMLALTFSKLAESELASGPGEPT